MYDKYNAKTLFRGCAVLSGCGIILLAISRLTYHYSSLNRDTQSHKHIAKGNCSSDDDERKPLLDETISNSNHTVQS